MVSHARAQLLREPEDRPMRVAICEPTRRRRNLVEVFERFGCETPVVVEDWRELLQKLGPPPRVDVVVMSGEQAMRGDLAADLSVFDLGGVLLLDEDDFDEAWVADHKAMQLREARSGRPHPVAYLRWSEATDRQIVRAAETVADKHDYNCREVADFLSRTVAGNRPRASAKDVEVLRLLAGSGSYRAIAVRLNMTREGLRSYLRRRYAAVGVSSRAQYVDWGCDHGYIRRDTIAGRRKRRKATD